MKSRMRGLTLLELMIALGVIAVSLIAILSMILSTSTLKDGMRDLSTAKEAAGAKLEEIKSQAFDAIPGYVTANGLFGVPGLNHPAFGSQGRGQIFIDASNPNLYDITVTISWVRQGGQGSGYTLRTLYSR
jgi:type II secretory pathway pseudopilin PulG